MSNESKLTEKMLLKKHWGNVLLNADSTICTIESVAELSSDMFISSVDDKFFKAKVFSPSEFKQWKNSSIANNECSYSTLIQLSTPKNIHEEYHFWIVDSKIAAASQFREQGRIMYSSVVPQNIHKFVFDVLRTKDSELNIHKESGGWQPYDKFVMDVCMSDDGLKVVSVYKIDDSGYNDNAK